MVVVLSFMRSRNGCGKNARLLFFAYLLILTLSQLFILSQLKPENAWAGDRAETESDSSKNSSEANATGATGPDADAKAAASEVKAISEPEKGVAGLPWPKIAPDTSKAFCQPVNLQQELTVSEKNRSPYFISKKLVEHKKELQDCYHRFLKIDPNLKGKAVVRLCINTLGLVKEARIVNSDLAHTKLEGSLLEIIQTWNDFGQAPENLGDRIYLQIYEFGLEPPKPTEK